MKKIIWESISKIMPIGILETGIQGGIIVYFMKIKNETSRGIKCIKL